MASSITPLLLTVQWASPQRAGAAPAFAATTASQYMLKKAVHQPGPLSVGPPGPPGAPPGAPAGAAARGTLARSCSNAGAPGAPGAPAGPAGSGFRGFPLSMSFARSTEVSSHCCSFTGNAPSH